MAGRTQQRTRTRSTGDSAIPRHSIATVRWFADVHAPVLHAGCSGHASYRRTSRLFAVLLLLQSLASMAAGAALDGRGLAPFSGSGSGEEDVSSTTPSPVSTSAPSSSSDRGTTSGMCMCMECG